jgi:hypothetical protein
VVVQEQLLLHKLVLVEGHSHSNGTKFLLTLPPPKATAWVEQQ